MSKKNLEAPEGDIKDSSEKPSTLNFKSQKFTRLFIVLAVAVLLLPTVYLGYAYASSPAIVRNPSFDHYHFRMQILINGNSENFGTQPYQQDYNKDACSAELTESPIHFHDNKDQFVHVHWDGVTGGMVMKNYGWNFVGGPDSALGYRMDNLPIPKKVPVKGELLPQVPDGANYYVYIGDENGYQEKSFEDWKNQDLEKFFGKSSNLPGNDGVLSTFLNNIFFAKAQAHDGHDHAEETDEQRLTRINNLLGNVVVFVQAEQPSDEQIKGRFNNLVPLGDSTCGG